MSPSSAYSAPPAASTTQSYTPVAVVLPPRPRSFDLTTVNPCELMPLARRAEFTLDEPQIGPKRVPNGLKCALTSRTEAGMAIYLDTDHGAQDRLDQATQRAAPLDRFIVNGFVVYSLGSEGDVASCIAVIDTGDGQNLRVQAYNPNDPPTEETCRNLRQWVPVVLDTLAQMQP